MFGPSRHTRHPLSLRAPLVAVLGLALPLSLVVVTSDYAATVTGPRTAGHAAHKSAQKPAQKSAQPSSQRPESKPGAPAPASAGPAPESAGILTLDWGDIDSTPKAYQGNYVVMQPWEYDRIPAMKKANPDVRILMYKDVSATRKKSCVEDRQGNCTGRDHEILPTGVGYWWAAKHRPRWFLRDAQGEKLEWSDWPGLYPMNVGNARYQRRWTRNVLAELRAHDWDGVMMDDVLTFLSHDVFGNKVSTKIPTDRAMYAASEEFLAESATAIKDAGFMAVPNVAFQWDDWKSVLEDWTPYVSGWENEYFVKWGLGDGDERFSGNDWEWKVRMAEWCAARDVPLLAVTYSTVDDRAAQLYHRASWLLTWNGRTGSSIFVPEEDFTDHWLSVPTIEIGTPLGPRYRVEDGVYRRDYTGGSVLVNPTRSRSRASTPGGYRNLRGQRVDSVRLAPTTATILRR